MDYYPSDRVIDRNSLMLNSSNNIQYITNKHFFKLQSFAPTVTLVGFTRGKISDEIGANTSVVTFSVDNPIENWKALATTEIQTPSSTVGELVGSGNNLSPFTPVNFNVDYNELTSGDRIYTITIYVQVEGVWY